MSSKKGRVSTEGGAGRVSGEGANRQNKIITENIYPILSNTVSGVGTDRLAIVAAMLEVGPQFDQHLPTRDPFIAFRPFGFEAVLMRARIQGS